MEKTCVSGKMDELSEERKEQVVKMLGMPMRAGVK